MLWDKVRSAIRKEMSIDVNISSIYDLWHAHLKDSAIPHCHGKEQ